MCNFNWGLFWNATSAVSTFSAVVVSLYLARRKVVEKLSLHGFRTYYDGKKIDYTVTIKNLGDIPVAITGFGFCERKKKEDIITNCHTFLKKDFQNKPFKILAGDIQLIQFELDPSNKEDYKIVKQHIENDDYVFAVKDSENKLHYICKTSDDESRK